MEWRPVVAGVVAAAVLASACGDSGTSESESDASTTSSAPESVAPSETDPFEIATFNAGLADGFVDLARERAPLVFEAVAGLEADVVFVEEVWEPTDVVELTDAAGERFPHSVFLDPMPEDPGTTPAVACPLGEAAPLEDCARARCADVPADELADCVLSGCGTEFSATCPDCQACLAANVGSTIDEAMTACAEGSAAYAYGGAFGIGFLSTLPLASQDSLVLDSSLTRRAVIHAEVDDPALGTVHLFGTHLSPVFTDVPYPGEGTWEEEQAEQIETIRAFIDDKRGADDTVVLLGDFNTGPAGTAFDAEVEENYELLVAGGWRNAYLEAADDDAECTYCAANPVVGGTGEGGVVIDHVLVLAGDETDLTGSRILDAPVEVVADGAPVTTALSDHYGVLAALSR